MVQICFRTKKAKTTVFGLKSGLSLLSNLKKEMCEEFGPSVLVFGQYKMV